MYTQDDTRIDIFIAKVEALETKVSMLENQRRDDRLRGLCLAVTVLIAGFIIGATLHAQAQTGPQTLVCKELRVVGDDGKTRVDVNSNTTGSIGSITTYGADGKTRIWLSGAGPTGSGYIAAYGSDGNLRFQVTTAANNCGYVEVDGTDGKRRASITNYTNVDKGVFSSYDATGSNLSNFP